MVGVPRSKACITCRKRRKGCDRKQPSCGQCEKLGVECGGYARERVFVNTTKEPPSDSSIILSPTSRRNASAQAVPDGQYVKLSWSSYQPNGPAMGASGSTAQDRAASWTSPIKSLSPTEGPLAGCFESSSLPARQRLERELMHRWMTSGYMSLCCMPEDGPVLQVELPRWAMDYGYMTDGIFALSLLEGVLRRDPALISSSPARSYVRVAMEYYDSSSAAFRAELPNVGPENIHIIYMYSCVAVIINMALFQCRYYDANEASQPRMILQHITGLMELFMGCTWLAEQHMDWALQSPIGPLIRRADAAWMPASEKPITGPVDLALTRLMRAINNSALMIEEDEENPASLRLDTYRNAVLHLRMCFAICIHSEMRGFCGEFPSLAGKLFMQFVKENDPIALFIVLHWGVLLQYADNWAWWAGQFGRIMVHELSDLLTATHPEMASTPEWRENIAWAKSEVTFPSSYNPLFRLEP